VGRCDDPSAVMSDAELDSATDGVRNIEQDLARATAYLESGHVEEARAIVAAANAAAHAPGIRTLRAKALLLSSRLELATDGTEAQARAQSALELAFEAGDTETAARAALALGVLARRHEHWEDALRLHREAAALSRHRATSPSSEA